MIVAAVAVEDKEMEESQTRAPSPRTHGELALARLRTRAVPEA